MQNLNRISTMGSTRFAPSRFSKSPFLSRKVRTERCKNRIARHLKTSSCEGGVTGVTLGSFSIGVVERDLLSENPRDLLRLVLSQRVTAVFCARQVNRVFGRIRRP
jgi:hypothetical protein